MIWILFLREVHKSIVFLTSNLASEVLYADIFHMRKLLFMGVILLSLFIGGFRDFFTGCIKFSREEFFLVRKKTLD